ncbi:hypothetical protein NADFUDRAFT_82014 [Nadsonia fulvescens var. elongata DSM 6958]|uniref:Actin binding protein n=1 Tax=Nadsonia fulvescens var. elongata DSM 6958 TaxID=857566 RepID=A0A1E3PQI9_9ASCO|nr:hypothetical protein NADFUDRAFT_82014 [Nadsonia fulvescens var. elongata DSM 6958]
MSTIDLSSHGKDLKKIYDAIVSKDPSISWAVFNYEASTTNALKPYAQGSSDLEDFVEEFDDGKVQFGFARITDPNSQLTKFVLIGWCGEGVPVRTKGYFNSNFAAVAKYFYGYHVQITARDSDDIEPSEILRKVASASGANYSGKSIPRSTPAPRSKPAVAVSTASAPNKPKPPANTASYESRPNIPAVTKPRVSTRPLFTQTTAAAGANEDDWGTNAPAIEETDGRLTKVKSAYQPTKVDIAAIKSQKPTSPPNTSFGKSESASSPSSENEIVKGTYQPIGKVDLSALRAQAKAAGLKEYNDKPETIKGSYEPVGKVDIAAIKAKGSKFEPSNEPKVSTTQSSDADESNQQAKSVSERMNAFSDSGRLTSLPKPKIEKNVSSRYQSSESSPSFGTRPPVSGSSEYGLRTNINSGGSRDFASQNGKTPAQIWAEKRGKTNTAPSTYKSTTDSLEEKFGQTNINDDPALDVENDGEKEEKEEEQSQPEEQHKPSGLRSNFSSSSAVPIISSGVPVLPSRGLPEFNNESEKEDDKVEDEELEQEEQEKEDKIIEEPQRIEEYSDFEQDEFEAPTPPPINLSNRPLPSVLPTRGAEPEPESEPEQVIESDESDTETRTEIVLSNAARALVQYDYDPQEDNEITLVEGDVITEIEFVDSDWWLGKNSKGDHGLFPANYVELSEGDEDHSPEPEGEIIAQPEEAIPETTPGPSARAEYDYEAVEDNELTFAENDIITEIDFVDEDWWSGVLNGERKLFPANYVSLLE